MKMRHDELMEILSQAGPKAKELVQAISQRRAFEIHIHISGPIIVGSDVAQTVAPILFKDHGVEKVQ